MRTATQGYANGVPGPSEALVPSDGRRAAPNSPAGRLWAQCTGFEALFLNTLMKSLRQTVKTEGGVLAPSPGQQMMTGLLDERLVDRLAERGTAGIATALYRDFKRHNLVQPESGESGPGQPVQPRIDGMA